MQEKVYEIIEGDVLGHINWDHFKFMVKKVLGFLLRQ